MIEMSRKMNGKPITSRPSEEGHGGSDMGLCIGMRRGIENFWKKRGLSGAADYSSYSKPVKKKDKQK